MHREFRDIDCVHLRIVLHLTQNAASLCFQSFLAAVLFLRTQDARRGMWRGHTFLNVGRMGTVLLFFFSWNPASLPFFKNPFRYI